MELKKNPEADLERKKGIYFQIGLLVSLAVVFIAFEWKTYEARAAGYGDIQVEEIDEELPPITQQEQPPPPPPPPPAVELEIVEDDEEIEEEVEIMETEATQQTVVVDIPVQEEVIEEPEIFMIVEQMPEFPGGTERLYKYLSDNIQYPAIAKEAGIAGTVYVSFVVGPEGKVSDVKVLRGVRGLDEEAIRVVKSMPAWTPGRQRGKAVSVHMNIPIRFTLR